MLSIEEAFDRTLSLPTTPLVREAPTNFASVIEDREGMKPRSASEKSRREERRERMTASPTTSSSSSSSMALSKRTFLEGLKRRTRTRSGENLFGEDRPMEEEMVLPARRASEASQKLVSQFDSFVSKLWSEMVLYSWLLLLRHSSQNVSISALPAAILEVSKSISPEW